ncbi:MAG: holo-ACP synthase [Clostridiales bacterium]|nr:holo-ACP synthase [Clostridiales bacterium]
MILGIGVDIVEIARFEKFTEASSFLQRVFTSCEREYLAKKTHASFAASAAGIFAAKEAVSKAIGTGFSGFHPSDIEILHNANGKPFVVLHKNARKTARKLCKRRFYLHITISHNTTNAIAYAVIAEHGGCPQ